MRILVVDDEAPTREYIVYCILRSGVECQVVASVSSAAQAIKQLEKQKIDVVLTDITMPRMNGLELLDYVREHWPQTDVVMLTCHDDFSYARSAMQQGVTEYILKSEVTEHVMKDLLHRITEKGEGEKPEKMVINWMAFGKYLSDAVKDHNIDLLNAETVKEQLSGATLKNFFVCIFRYGNTVLDEVAKVKYTWVKKQWFFPYEDQFILMIIELEGGLSSSKQQDCIGQFILRMKTGVNTKPGISKLYYDISGLKRAVLDAMGDITKTFYGTVKNEPVKIDDTEQGLNQLYVYRNNAITALNEKNFIFFRECIHELLEFAHTKRIPVDILKKVICFIAEAGNEEEEKKTIFLVRIAEAYSVQDLRQALEEFTEHIEQKARRYSANIENAISFIQQHFSESITLQDAAGSVYLNPEYFSRRFKKEVGVNFSEYIQTLRMQKAQRLLQSTTLRISDIAEQVGIPNVSHFASVYKKEFGHTPAENRK